MSKEVAVISDNGLGEMYPMLSGDADALEVISENLGDEDFKPHELQQLRAPSGGGTAFEIETLDGESDVVKTVEGIILSHQFQRAYHKISYDESGGEAPDCQSEDCKTGIGDPGGDCLTCPFAQYESAEKGKGQACQQSRVLYLLRPGQFVPMAVKVPPASFKSCKKYLLKLASDGLPYYSVTSVIGLEADKNEAGLKFSRLTFQVGQKLSPEQKAAVKAASQSLKAAISG